MECELCGRAASGKARVEGTIVSVCDSCASMGERIYEAAPVRLPDKPRTTSPEEVYFVNNFSSVAKNARESHALTREQLAEKIKERISTIERIEKGLRPEKRVAEKLQRVLGVKLMASADAERSIVAQKSSEPLTLGDIVTIKKRKK